MAITYPLTLPSAPKSYTLTPKSVTSMSASVFTGEQYVQNFSGQWWELSLTYPSNSRTTQSYLSATITAMLGRSGTFYFGPVGASATPSGSISGSPTVVSPSVGVNTLSITGLANSTTGVLKAGDFIQVASHLYYVLTDANSDGSGNATVDVFPNVRSDATNGAAVVYNNPKGVFRPTDDTSLTVSTGNVFGEITMNAREAI